MSLVKRSVEGSIWTLIDIVFNKAIYFIATLVLARLLGPAEFGLIGMIMVFFTIGTTLVDSGLSVSLIRAKKPSIVEYSTLFYLNIGMSFIAYLLVFVLAPFVAQFYSQPILELLVKIYCLGFVITAFRMVPQAILVKEMNFKKIALLNIPGNIVGLFVGVWMAKNNYQVWSIVGLFLSTQIIATITYWFFIDWKPQLCFSSNKMKLHWNFGYKLMLSAQLNTVFDNIYNLLIGRVFNVQYLGYYERGYTLTNYPISILSGVINKVSLPMFVDIMSDKVLVLNVYRKIMLVSYYITSILMLGALVLAKPIFLVLLGNQWMPAIPYFQILCLAYIFYPIHSLNINLLSVLGRSDLFLKLEVIKKVVIVLSVVVGFKFGIMGLLWSTVFTSVLALFINTHFTGGFIKYKTWSQILDLFPTSIVVGASAGLMYLLNNLFVFENHIIHIIILSSMGMFLIILLSELFKLYPYLELKNICLDYFKK